ncbi:ATP-dependent DNA helicase DinG [Photobacterium carnosum]|uniref:ATP-dependent DNA helicase DinG n=1 Tax=Photobacterium carnosum TaxID=2023717 RepID=UPI00128B8760|nr:ATP-dependent DNA helicase DinG [Photobacterium carnosum]KAE8178923.1 ATP-dependent DNA helicase DinG [Photobacterium carnosum]MCD9493712.1 ATP-dependent DNA helicase DinG [Photobacterium carnosum]MCD9536478.1 ATP-dependent DNA helicase DinG [Photobacterium carnosum]MCD9543793.1 ATP-dependent DNA helicase DinG [Photobacterium carnosum]MCD9557197.1 ATP-dependent DNA helicase DinG [Photobacterium carnosum]
MLHNTIKSDIKQCYTNLSHQLDNFIPRRAQNYLVAEIAKTLAGEYHKKNRVLVAEAGTGIGKSLAYLIGGIPFALFNNKKLLISTATVALQEQLITKDLPLFNQIFPREFSFILAKGRQRYCCNHKLEASCSTDSELQLGMWEEKPKKSDLDLLKRMLKATEQNKWDGDRDSWPTTIPDKVWQQIMADKHSCHAGMPKHRSCPFAKAREHLDKADVIVANHALLMADIELGGGVILPEPEQTIYVIDEAHHLPRVARDFSSAASSLKGAATWLEKLNQIVSKFAELADYQKANRFQNAIQDNIQHLVPTLNQIANNIDSSKFNKDGVYRFEHGELPAWLEEEAKGCKEASKKTLQSLGKIQDLITERTKENAIIPRLGEQALTEIGFYLQRLENLEKVWSLMAQPNHKKGAPLARWIEKSPERENDYIIEVSPLEVGYRLDQLLWSRAAGAILVSATLRALNQFTFFCRQAGISESETEGTRFLALASPFDYQNNARLVIPDLKLEPQAEKFTDLLIEVLPEYLEGETASLVLFSSYWQMNKVTEALRPLAKKNKWQLLVQGELSRNETLKKHKENCKNGIPSILFGTGSFSEGLDLPGDLLKNLIITKIPFAVPTSPVEEAHAEYIESKGGNPFLQISVPEASKKLIQSVGRLLRKERDSGRVVILDRRIINRRYGKALLDSLPPFKRVIEYN